MDIIDIQKKLEDNRGDISLAKRQLKKIQDKLDKTVDEEQKRILEDKIVDCKSVILEYQKDEYILKGQIRNIELQELKGELDFQLENGLITQIDYNIKMDKLKSFSGAQKVYTDTRVAECEQKQQKMLSQKNDLDDNTKKGMKRFYQLARKNKINKLSEFMKKCQEFELSVLNQKVGRGEISPEEYADKVEYLETSFNTKLEDFEGMYDELKSDIEAPRLEEEQTLQMISEIKKYKGKTVNYQGKEQSFDDLLLEHIARRIAEEEYQYNDLRKSTPAFHDLPDFETDKLEDLQVHIREQLTDLLPDDLNLLLESGQKDIVIPTIDGKSISYSVIGIKKFIREMKPIIDEQKQYEVEQQSSEKDVAVKQEQWQEPEEQIINMEEIQRQIDENVSKIDSKKRFIASLTMSSRKEELLRKTGLDINALSDINDRKKLESQIQVKQLRKKNMECRNLLQIGKAQNLEEDLRNKLEKGEISQDEFDQKMKDIQVYKLYINLDTEVQRSNYEISELRLRAESPDFKGDLHEEIKQIRARITGTGILQRSIDLKNLRADAISRTEQMLDEVKKSEQQSSPNQNITVTQEKSVQNEQENEQMNFSEPKEALKQGKTNHLHETKRQEKQKTYKEQSERTVTRDEYLKKKLEVLFSKQKNSERYEKLRREFEEIESNFRVEELEDIVQEVPAEDKEQVRQGINRQREKYKAEKHPEEFGRRTLR